MEGKKHTILLIGGGGREHTLCWKLRQSDYCQKIYIAPGNAGTSKLGENVQLDCADIPQFKNFCLEHQITMIIVGPEAPLVNGLQDQCQSDTVLKNILFIGPSTKGAMLEGSKAYAKAFMAKYQIPTAAYKAFGLPQLEEAYKFLEGLDAPYVLKADGLAAGKGVIISKDLNEAKRELKEMLSGKFGEASQTVVIEEFLSGLEFSVFALTDGQNYVLLPEAKDYKRIGEGDTGLNTGGMGAISPVPFVDQIMMKKVIDRVIEPTIKGIKEEEIDYKGFVFFGLIEVNGDPFVIEYNCRLGDPETEVIIPRLKNDLVPLLESCATKKLDEEIISIDERSAATIMLVSGGYPEAYEKGKKISALNASDDSIIFHAGTQLVDGQIKTSGGRVLSLTSFGMDKNQAVQRSLALAEQVQFEGKYFRSDIGKDLD